MPIAGIDPDSFGCHVVLLSEDDDTATWHVFPFGKRGDAFERSRRIRDAMPPRGWWDDMGVIAAGIEDPRGPSRKVDAPLYRAQGAIIACLPPDLAVKEWKPQQWRSALGIAPRGKEPVREFALSRWLDAPDGVSQDLCDAYCIALATRDRVVVSAAT